MPMLLELDTLCVSYTTRAGQVHAVDGVTLSIGENEVLGLAGKSGCGKTTLIRSLLRLLPRDARVSADRLPGRART